MITDADKTIFGGNREKAIQRDNEQCVNCGMTRQQHKEKYNKDFDVDHIDGFGTSVPIAVRNNNLDNLRTLCKLCHRRLGLKRGQYEYTQVFDEPLSAVTFRKYISQAFIHVAHGNPIVIKRGGTEFLLILEKDLKGKL